MVEVFKTFDGRTRQTTYDLPLASSLGDSDVIEILRTSGATPESLRVPISTLKLNAQYSYGCLLTSSVTQTASTSGALLAERDTETYDSGGFHSTASEASKIIIPAAFAGYLGQLFWGVAASTANGTLAVSVIKGGSSFVGNAGQSVIVNGNIRFSSITAPVVLAASDYFQLSITATTANRTIEVDNRTYFGLRIMGPLAA